MVLLLLLAASGGLRAQGPYRDARTGTVGLRLDGGTSWSFGSSFENVGANQINLIQPYGGAGILVNILPYVRVGADYSFTRMVREQVYSSLQPVSSVGVMAGAGAAYRDFKTRFHGVSLTGEYDLLEMGQGRVTDRLSLWLGTGLGCLFAGGNIWTLYVADEFKSDNWTQTVRFGGHNEPHRYCNLFIPVTLSLEYAFLPQVALSVGGGYRFLPGKQDFAPKSQTTTLSGKMDLIEAALSSGFVDEKTALGLISDAITAMKGSVDGLDGKIDDVVTALGNLVTAYGDNTTVLEQKLTDIFDAIDGLTDFDAIVPAILAAVQEASKPIPNIERQWVIKDQYDSYYGYYDRYYDFGYTFKNFLVGWDSYETPYEAQIWNSSKPYSISLLSNGWVKLAHEDGRYFYLFTEVTATTATAKFYYRDYADVEYMGGYALDDYGWTNGYVFNFELVDPALPLTWSQFVLRIGEKNYHLNAASYDNGYDALKVLRDDILGGGSGADLDVVAINGAGTAEEFADLATAGVDFTGKIVVLQRGSITFWEKLKNASEAGAIAVICANNVDGTVIPNVSSLPTTVTKIPFFTVTKDVGELLGLDMEYGFYYGEYKMSWINAFFATIHDPNNVNTD